MSRDRMARLAAIGLIALGCAQSIAAQPAPADIDREIHRRWAAIVKDVPPPPDPNVPAIAPRITVQERRLLYRRALEELSDDPVLQRLAAPDLTLIDQQTPERERQFIATLKDARATHTQPKSLNATSTNPGAGEVAERSGFTELLAVALNSQDFFNADNNAVSLNLSALAVFSLADPEVYSELHRYQQHSLLRRIGGTVVFGAKVPEKEITGISGLPAAETLLDVFTWDVKVRVLGDKDPRAARWYRDTLGRQALLNQLTVVQADVPPADVGLVTEELARLIGERLAALRTRIQRSPQLTVKTSGTHLTKEAGRNKYAAGLLFDVGFSGARDVTFNALYSVTDDVSLGTDQTFQVRQFTFNGALTSRLARDVLVSGRAIDWSNGATANVFTNKSGLPIPVHDTWKLFSTFEIPVNDAATIPISIVFTNDANELKKTKYVSGFIGISYDFAALSKLFAKP